MPQIHNYTYTTAHKEGENVLNKMHHSYKKSHLTSCHEGLWNISVSLNSMFIPYDLEKFLDQ